MHRVAATVAAVATCLATLAVRLEGQEIWRADADWRTVRTAHFELHYPREFEPWSIAVAERLESVRGAVEREVGSAPKKRVTVLVTDPLNVSNGSAWPFREAPTIILWPTPPDPRSAVGDTRSWPEVLSVHEFAHLAHLMRPGRSPRDRFFARILPLGVGPIALKSPRWIVEGYATYVEGRLTGSGRPHGPWRPATLRQWALEGRLPTYEQLSGSGEYFGGSFAYLGGSAFLEWLAARRGDSTIVHLWRRMTARTDRTFDQAFAGVYGGSPRELYGRFSAELTGRALEIERVLRDSGLVEGTLVQRLSWSTGDPAVSPDGERVAVVLRSKDLPSRVVIWSTSDEPDTAASRRRARSQQRDPEDVQSVEFYPPPKRPVATLRARGGHGFDNPRFLPDGRRLLVTRFSTTSDGSLVPDLYVWDYGRGTVARVTRGAGIRMADPSPDGRFAVGTRCTGGSCGIVRVTLATGAVETLVGGTPLNAYYRPRYSPDGRTIVASVSDSGRWRLIARDQSGALHWLGPDDDANRYDAEFSRDGRSLLHVSDAGGIPNIALLDLQQGTARTLTRVTGAAVAPAIGRRGDVFFLALHATGYDVRRIPLDSITAASRLVSIDPRLAPASRIPVVPADTFPTQPIGGARPYRLGPREYRLLNGYSLGADGKEAVLGVASTDKVGRLIWTLQGALGSGWRPRGAALAATYRGVWPWIDGELFTLRRDASRQHPVGFTGPTELHDLKGASVGVRGTRFFDGGSLDARVGASLQQLAHAGASGARRNLAFTEVGVAARQEGDQRFATQRFALTAAYGTGPDTLATRSSFARGVATAALAMGNKGNAVRAEGMFGLVSSSASAFERFTVGGAAAAYVDDATLTQWVAMPALPFGVLRGQRYASYRISLGDEMFSPFFWSAAAGDSLRDWIRVVGVDAHLAVPPLPVLRLPSTDVRAGVGYTLDDPWRKRLRGYMAVRYRP
jgi:Tol biopolymer transport system component